MKPPFVPGDLCKVVDTYSYPAHRKSFCTAKADCCTSWLTIQKDTLAEIIICRQLSEWFVWVWLPERELYLNATYADRFVKISK